MCTPLSRLRRQLPQGEPLFFLALDLRSSLDVIISDVNAFIIGTRPISEWEQVVADLYDAGLEDLIEIYNTALARIKG